MLENAKSFFDTYFFSHISTTKELGHDSLKNSHSYKNKIILNQLKPPDPELVQDFNQAVTPLQTYR